MMNAVAPAPLMSGRSNLAILAIFCSLRQQTDQREFAWSEILPAGRIILIITSGAAQPSLSSGNFN